MSKFFFLFLMIYSVYGGRVIMYATFNKEIDSNCCVNDLCNCRPNRCSENDNEGFSYSLIWTSYNIPSLEFMFYQ